MHLFVREAQSKTELWLSFLQPLMTALAGVVTIFFVKYFSKESDKKAAHQSKVVNEKIDAVALETSDQTKKIDAVAETADQTKSFVNGAHGVALRTVYEQATRIANITGNPDDIDRAHIAKTKMVAHEEQTAIIDEKEDQRRADVNKKKE